jgi:hypothetical protein
VSSMNDTIGRLSVGIAYLASKIPSTESNICQDTDHHAVQKRRYLAEAMLETKSRKAARVVGSERVTSTRGSTSIALLSEAASRILVPTRESDESLAAIWG